jgi:cell wall-associated NlpC family hydrolase
MINVLPYLRVPYVSKGRAMDGADCWGMVRLVLARELGQIVPSYTDAYIDSEDETVASAIDLFSISWSRIEPGAERVGDVLVINVLGEPYHCGVIVAPDRFLHTLRKRGPGCEPYKQGFWAKRIEGIYRWPT